MTEEQGKIISDWIHQNAERYWLSAGGPLAARSIMGGADVIIVDDLQKPELIPIAKKADLDLQVVFHSHIQIRSDLAAQEGTPTAEVWHYLWKNVREADLFISYPVREFVPRNITA
jgi:hypothetical protein